METRVPKPRGSSHPQWPQSFRFESATSQSRTLPQPAPRIQAAPLQLADPEWSKVRIVCKAGQIHQKEQGTCSQSGGTSEAEAAGVQKVLSRGSPATFRYSGAPP